MDDDFSRGEADAYGLTPDELARCRRYLEQLQPIMAPGSTPAPVVAEDRTTHFRIWWREDHPEGAFSAFGPFPGADRFCVVGVPVGWSLAPHERFGPVLVNVFGDYRIAQEARLWAAEGSNGFRLLEPLCPIGPLDDVRDVPRRRLRHNILDMTRFP